MDPDANLEEQLRLTKTLYKRYEDDTIDLDPSDVARLCELVEALDEWLRGKGAIPKRWEKARKPVNWERVRKTKEKI